MIRQDYIKRLIEEVGEALARLAGQSRADLTAAEETLRQLKGKLPIVPRLLETESPAALRALLGSDEAALVAAQLFLAEGQLFETKGEHKDAIRCYAKSVRLFTLSGGRRAHPEQAATFGAVASRWFPDSLTDIDRAALGL